MVPFIITVFVDITIGLIALSNRKNPAAMALAIFVFCMGLWQTELFLLTIIEDKKLLSPWFHLTRAGMFFLPSCAAYFSWRVCGSGSVIFKVSVLWLSCAVAGILSILNNTILPSTLKEVESGYLPEPDFIYFSFIVMFVYVLISSISLIALHYRKVAYREKRRIKWMLISLIFGFSFGGLTVYLVLNGIHVSKTIGALSNAVIIGILLYSVINHHLADFGSVLTGLATRVVVMGFLIGFAFTGLELLDKRYWSANTLLLSFVTLMIMLEAYPRLIRFVYPGARKLLLEGGYDFHTVTRDFRYSLKRSVEIIDLESILDNLVFNNLNISSYSVYSVHRIENSDHIKLQPLNRNTHSSQLPSKWLEQMDSAEQAKLIMKDETAPPLLTLIEENKAIACCPLWHQSQLVGVLFVGPSKSYHPYYFRYDDIRVLEWLMQELPAELSRIVLHDAVLKDLLKAQKTVSLMELMNQYHHEIKAPLAIIDGVLSSGLYDRERQQQIILEQVERGSQLITMMSKVFRGQRERAIEPVQLLSLVKKCTMLFERELDRIDYQIDASLKVLGDSNDLTIMLINLLKNAVEAKSPERPLKIKISAEEDASKVSMSIRDNGCGIAKVPLENLWCSGHTDKAGGSGIGLKAVKRIVDEHSASISVSSKLGEGTEFRIKFPKLTELKKHAPASAELEPI